MSGYEIKVSVTAHCPCCGEAIPSSHYLTMDRPRTSSDPLERDNPYERCERHVFVSPCATCFTFKPPQVALAAAAEQALEELRADAASLRESHTIQGGLKAGQLDTAGEEEVPRVEALVETLEKALTAARGGA